MNDRAERFLKEVIDEFFVQKGIKTDENEFRKYLFDINMLNPKANFIDRVFITKANIKLHLEKFHNPIKNTANLLGLTYKEIAEMIGYSEETIKSSAKKRSASEPMKKALELVKEIYELKKELQEKDAKIAIYEELLTKKG